ncbi:MAG: DnaJ domain-containing protein [Spirulinaceae cyanobacterium SM2_1_0]|nr:DnaJ domain-containing protein [Spirulinaceae cyanobacterium SM2_1_0]
MSDVPDYYALLAVAPTATTAEIKAAFRALARQYHPDLNPDAEAQEQFKQICAAYEVLSDPERRHEYDRDRADPEPAFGVARDARDCYLRGIEHALRQDYAGALSAYREAIAREPQFLAAYVKAAETQFKLNDDREVLETCRQALQVEPTCAEAYFFQGRSRYRLGSVQSALESYQQALHNAPEAANIYYHRGLAHHDLGDRARAAADWRQAAQLFQAQGDHSGERLAIATLRRSQGNLWHWRQWLSLGRQAALGLVQVAFNPSRGSWAVPAQLRPLPTALIGLGYAAIANLAWLGGVYWGWRDLIRFEPVNLLLVGAVPLAVLAAGSAIARLIWHSRAAWASDFWLSGVALLPVGSLALASGFADPLGATFMVNLSVLAVCWTVLLLYNGAVQLLQLSVTAATWWTAAALLTTGWLTWIIFSTLF